MSDKLPPSKNAAAALPANGAVRAAAVLLGLGPDVAAEVFRQFAEADVRRVAAGAKELRGADPATVTAALQAFVDAMSHVGADVLAGDDVLREVATKALGGDVAKRAFDGTVPPPPRDEMLGPVSQADPEALAMVLSREQPQTIALVLSSIDPDRAASTMEHLPEEQRSFVLRRMAAVESVAPEVLREVGQALATELQTVVAGGVRKVDGKSVALEVLRRSSSEQQRDVVAQIEKDDPTLASELRSKLFTFADLINLTDRDVQQLLKEVDSAQLKVALKGVSEALRDKILHNMSTRAAEMLADDLASLGPVKLSAVEAAQAEIVKSALELAEAGRVTLVRPTDKML
ncbi:MAG: flagellar motor switch protein FliG [Myxococcales bacterium]